VHSEIDPGVSQFLFELPLNETSLSPNTRARLETIPKEQQSFALEADGVPFSSAGRLSEDLRMAGCDDDCGASQSLTFVRTLSSDTWQGTFNSGTFRSFA
jgi:hypothetical protein